jgi:FkbM family methyltransferase
MLSPAGGIEKVRIGPYRLEIDHRIEFQRYMAYGLFEERELKHIKQIVRRGDCVFDVGANIGYLAAQMAHQVGSGGKVYAFEPAPSCQPSLNALAATDPRGVFVVLPWAVGAVSKEVTFYETPRVFTSGFSAVEDPDGSHPVDGVPIRVRQVALDDFIRDHRISRVDFIKIDVEGGEEDVIGGMREILRAPSAPALMIECTCEGEQWDRLRRYGALLSDLGYRPFVPGSKLIAVRVDELKRGDRFNLFWLKSP